MEVSITIRMMCLKVLSSNSLEMGDVSRSDISFLKNYLSFLSLLAVMYNTGRNKVLNSYGQSAAIMTWHFLFIVFKFCKG